MSSQLRRSYVVRSEGEMKRVYAHEEHCMGCGLCEIYCTLWHSKSKELIKAFKREHPKPISRIKLFQEKPVSFAVQCRHCNDAPCVFACLSGAMRIDEETGLVMYDDEKCIGCLTCIMVCPFGAIRVDPYRHKVVAKCDLCQELDAPACVANCPNEALTFEEV
jgi:carbon-monoxide dehydrogenase iron sulfur subunit